MIYTRYSLIHPDGTLMCYCSKKRAMWYVNRNLGTLKNKSVHLNFIPNGYGDSVEILEPRENICVISGTDKNLSKHHVIPVQYRKYFEEKYKSKNSCDVVILERQIHDEYELEADKLKLQLELDYGDPKTIELDKYWNESARLHSVIKQHYNSLPPSKQVYFKLRYNGLMDKYNFDESSFKNKTSDYLFLNNLLVVEKINPIHLIILWKLHFLKYGKPQYLPRWWKPNLIKIIKKGNNDILYYDLKNKELIKLLQKYDLYEYSKNYY